MNGLWRLTRRAFLETNGAPESGVLIDSFNAGMFTCNEVAWSLLDALREGADLAELTAKVMAEFEVSQETAQRETLVFLHQLKRLGLADVRE